MSARRGTVTAIAAAMAIVFVTLLTVGVMGRMRTRRELKAASDAAQSAVPAVAVVRPQRAGPGPLTLDATTQGLTDAVIYARTNGYLRRRYVDIGDRVRAGQLLAEIESPELDQQLRQARADLHQAEKYLELQQASLELARATRARYLAADSENAVSKEAVDQSVAAARTAQAAVAAAEASVASYAANVQRLEELTSFERVVAPFAGIITQRNVDVGTLITAGSPTNNTAASPLAVNGSANGLFEIAKPDELRVFVNVPQAFASSVAKGVDVRIRLRGREEPFAGRVTRTATAIDPGTRTLLAEVDIPNPSRELLPGLFVYVEFDLTASGTRWRVPATAVLIDAQGTRVATVASDGTLRFRPVVLGRDFGASIDVQGGLTGDEILVRQPTVSLQEGQRVQPVEPGQS
jgi:RND family efflux transporter MFP subunit